MLIRCLLGAYSVLTRCLFNAYSMPIRCLKADSMVRCLFDAYAVLISCLGAYSAVSQCLFGAYSLLIRSLLGAYSLLSRCLLSVYSKYMCVFFASVFFRYSFCADVLISVLHWKSKFSAHSVLNGCKRKVMLPNRTFHSGLSN